MITILLTVFFTAAGFIFAGSYSDYKIFIHELGHWIYGLGGTISAYVTYVNVDWSLATIGSLLFQLQITLAIVGYARDHYKFLAGFGIGWANFIATDVFLNEEGQFLYDIRFNKIEFIIITTVYLIRIYANAAGLVWESVTNSKVEFGRTLWRRIKTQKAVHNFVERIKADMK